MKSAIFSIDSARQLPAGKFKHTDNRVFINRRTVVNMCCLGDPPDDANQELIQPLCVELTKQFDPYYIPIWYEIPTATLTVVTDVVFPHFVEATSKHRIAYLASVNGSKKQMFITFGYSGVFAVDCPSSNRIEITLQPSSEEGCLFVVPPVRYPEVDYLEEAKKYLILSGVKRTKELDVLFTRA